MQSSPRKRGPIRKRTNMDSRFRGNDGIEANRKFFNVLAAVLVAVDVGHYTAEPGVMSASGVPEFEYNLTLALELKTELEKIQMQVRLIGERGLLPTRRTGCTTGALL